jgi:cell division protein FtsW
LSVDVSVAFIARGHIVGAGLQARSVQRRGSKRRAFRPAALRGTRVARKLKSDKVLFVATILLVCVSVVMVYSASAMLALERFQEPYRFLMRQALWAAMGIGGLGIQPSELAKVACVLFAALTIERRMHRINEVSYSLTPIVIVTGAVLGLIVLEPDLGTSISLLLTIGVMIFAAGLSYRYLALAAVVVIPTVTAVLISAPYRRRRLFAFLDPWQDPLGDGFQIIQSRIAVGTGGVTGRGLMEGVQKLFYLPEPHTDFIYAVIAEELGLIGASAVLICFCIIAWRGLHIASRAEDRFGALLALGLTTMIAVQAFVNMSVVLGLLPTKGIPLPLVSNGGSSLLVSLLAIGMLLNISQHEASAT